MFEGLLQPTHLLLIFGIAMVLFGGKKLPELGRGLGQGIRGFKAALHEEGPPASGALPAKTFSERDKSRSTS
jgi:sec-independent protein translocase protein TatA